MKAFNVAIIDDGVNPRLILKHCYCYEVVGKDVQTIHEWPDDIGHATKIASVIAEKCECWVNIYSIKIFENTLEPVNIEKFITALDWCLINDIDVINLSIGSVQFADRVRFVELMAKIQESGIIVVAAYSNDNLLTFPASLNSVIGVRQDLLGILQPNEHIYCENPIDGIEVISGCQDYFFNIYHKKCNSFATAEITSKVCNHIMRIGRSSLAKIKDFLKATSKEICDDNNENNYMLFIDLKQEMEITQPTIYMENSTKIHDNILMNGIISAFMEAGYNCAGIAERTSIEKNFFVLPYLEIPADITVEKCLVMLSALIIPDIWLVGDTYGKGKFKPELFDLSIQIKQDCVILKWDENVETISWEDKSNFITLIDKILEIMG